MLCAQRDGVGGLRDWRVHAYLTNTRSASHGDAGVFVLDDGALTWRAYGGVSYMVYMPTHVASGVDSPVHEGLELRVAK